jgi:hypothetical protein
MARGSSPRRKWRTGRPGRGAGDAEQAQRRFLRILAAVMGDGLNPRDRDRVEREAALLGLNERAIRLDCLRLAVQAMAREPSQISETAQSYVNFVLGLPDVPRVPPLTLQDNRNKVLRRLFPK